MKRISNLAYVLLGIGFLATGCSEDEIMKVTPANPGDAIVFGATASIENGSPLTRTSYGDKGNGFQVINWETGDKIRIACAQAAQDKVADYTVQDITEGSTSGDKESSATTLVKQGNGLQWGTGEHTFYAVYPSPAHFSVTEENQQPHTQLQDNMVTGVLASVQNPKGEGAWNNNNQYVLNPDMDQAYMAARAHYDAAKEGGEGVTLHFKPLVTAIEVEVKAGDINPNATGDKTLTMTDITLRSASGKHLVGKFSADISGLNNDENLITGANVTDNTPSGISTSNVNIVLPRNGVTLEKDQSIVVTFFILPTATFEEGDTDLKLDVGFTFDGTNVTKTCTLGKEVKAHCKYYFSNITLPTMQQSEISSNWVSRLEDDILISQLSIPGAGNAASKAATTYREQTKSLTELWNMGVRCFELVSDYNNGSKKTNYDLASCYIWCGGNYVKSTTFSSALDELQGLLNENPREFLIVVCSYQAFGLDRSPQTYMDAFVNSYGNIDQSKVVALTPNSTVGDIRGKIAFVGRISQEGEDNSLALNNVPDWFVYIKGWGSLKDKWHKRYGSSYNPAYDMSYNGSTLNVEDRLWETGNSSNTTNWTPTPSGYPTPNVDFNYNTSKGGYAWVQEWMRVVPEGGIEHYSLAKVQTNISLFNPQYSYLHINWPGSYNEKKDNIITTFEKAKNEQDRLYINSLCGYYVNNTNADSYTPLEYKNSGKVTVNGHTYNLGKQNGGLGGTFDTYNNDINKDVFNYIYEQVTANATGPMGIVMMDYIGANAESTQLPALIYQNNFKFPLKTGSTSTSTKAQYDASYVRGGNAIGWE